MNSLSDLPSEYQCHKIFYTCIWGEVSCKKCGSKMLKIKPNYEYCSHCRNKSSAKADTTIFKNCKLSYRQIFVLIWCWQQKFGIKETIAASGTSYPTTAKMYRHFRTALKPSEEILEGIVEVDGSYYGRRKYGSQRLVVGGISHEGKVRLRIVPDRTRKSAEEFVLDTVKLESEVLTDGFSGYDELPLYGYKWSASDHNKGEFGPTNHIEGLWSSIKRSLRHIYRDLTFTEQDLALILREYELRYNDPTLFKSVENFLKICSCSAFFN